MGAGASAERPPLKMNERDVRLRLGVAYDDLRVRPRPLPRKQQCVAAFAAADARLTGAAAAIPWAPVDQRGVYANVGDGWRQRAFDAKPVASLDDLFAVAARAREPFLATIEAALDRSNVTGVTLEAAELKPRKRAAEKLAEGGGRDPSAVFDVVRCAVVCDDEAALVAVHRAFTHDETVEIVRVKNRFTDATFTGWRDVLVSVSVPIVNEHLASQHLCEARTTSPYLGRGVDARKRRSRVALLTALPLRVVSALSTTESLVTKLCREFDDDAIQLQNLVDLLATMSELSHAAAARRRIDVLEHTMGGGLGAEARSVELLFKKALELKEKQYGPDHPATAASCADLAALLCGQLKFRGAEDWSRRALDIRVNALGKESPEVADSLDNLALILRAGGRVNEAEPLLRRSLGIREARWPDDHADVAISLSNLAGALRDLGRCADAEPLSRRALDPLYREALAIYERRFGADSAHVGRALHNLANLLRADGRYGEAPAVDRALAIKEAALGPEHPDVAATLECVGRARATGGAGDAEPALDRCLQIRTKRFGPDHADVGSTLRHLSALHRSRKDYDRAELAGRCLEIAEAPRPAHPEVAAALDALAHVLKATARSQEAEWKYERALKIREELRRRLGRRREQPASFAGTGPTPRHAEVAGRDARLHDAA
ncbi:hypothetical protein JL720_7112 [Aureococcus anophagefferens]|nr:hypothetical protein JL720_7112 [Aureococcus anophagefferens]